MQLNTLKSCASAFGWKVVVFLMVAGLLSGTEHLLLVWFHPTSAAELAVRQFEPNDSMAESLRSYEFAKNVGMTIRNAAIALFGLAMFGGHAGSALNRLTNKGDPSCSETQ